MPILQGSQSEEPLPLLDPLQDLMEQGSPVAKESSGSLQSPIVISSPSCQSESLGSEDSWSSVQEDSCTGSSSSTYPASSLSEESNPFLGARVTGNSVVHKRLRSMSGRKTLESPGLNLNWEPSPSKGTSNQTGSVFGISPRLGKSSKSLLLYELHIIGLSAQLQQTLCNRMKLLKLYLSFGALLEQASRDAHGKKRVYSLTLRVRLQNFGAATEVNQMLFWMNFVEISRSAICSDGSIGTRSIWKTKGPVSVVPSATSGSHPISPPMNGIHNLMEKPSQH